ncbi:MAG TPA: hypothetical protein VGN65_00255, partial [Casimicrobiaceae bacterium]
AYLARLDQFSARTKDQHDLFAANPDNPSGSIDPRAQALIDHLTALDPDTLTPRDAQAALYALKRLIEPDPV